MMNNNFIKKINIDWQEISDNSYLKEISSISKLEEYRDFTPKEIFYERYGGKSLHEQSHGESFLSFFQANAREGLYIMDEPEAALSPPKPVGFIYPDCKDGKGRFSIYNSKPFSHFISNSRCKDIFFW